MSAETFLLLTVLAHRARSRYFTANALYKLLTYLLTDKPKPCSKLIHHRRQLVVPGTLPSQGVKLLKFQ